MAMRPCDGTFTKNALQHGVAGLNIDAGRIGTSKNVPASVSDTDSKNCYGAYGKETGMESGHDPNVGRWPANVILDPIAAELLDLQSGISESVNRVGVRSGRADGLRFGMAEQSNISMGHTDSGGASRFFYTAKADSNERGTGNTHPTVKPLDLMRYLCKLLCPPAVGALLDPFMGSGSTLLAGRRFFQRVVGIEIEERYCEIAAKRLAQEVLELQ